MIDRDGILGTFIRWSFIPLFVIVTILAAVGMGYLAVSYTSFWTILLLTIGIPFIIATWVTFVHWAEEYGNYEGLKEEFLPVFEWWIIVCTLITIVILIAIILKY